MQIGSVARHLRPLVILTYAEICFRLSCTQISPDELKALATAFDDPDKVQGTGLRISEKKYFTILINKEKGEESVQLKKGVSPNSIPLSKNISIARLS
jgi:Profilin